jgi:hypothetical protein
MKRSAAIYSIGLFVSVFIVAPSATAENWVLLRGSFGSSSEFKSGWLDLRPPFTFAKGERLRITVGGTASQVVVRLLQEGSSPNDQSGILGKFVVDKKDRVVLIELGDDHPAIKQISVHGGESPWENWNLGGGNGPATIQLVERASPPTEAPTSPKVIKKK